MQGRRRPDGTRPYELEPGDFSKMHVTNADETEEWEMWYVCAPDGAQFYLANEHNRRRASTSCAVGRAHEIEEHEDGMITVEPRPNNPNSILSPKGWHGWIRHGVWEHI